ncbi:MAG: autotransporter-associated beta strand repeat-containing protein [Thermoguttaceae bacterium]|jgi:autotransporter-associated beta strand protein
MRPTSFTDSFYHKLFLIGAALLALFGSILSGEFAFAADDVYMFSYFRDPDGTSGMYYAYSLDGISYHAVNGDVAITGPMAGTTMRDVHIIYGQDGMFHLTHTTEPWTVNTKICYGESADLITWTDKKYVDVMASVAGTQQAWAPETTWDAEIGKYVVYWSSYVTGASNRKIYYSTTTDFSTYSAPAVLYDPGFPVIDADIRKDTDGKYVMFVKNENTGIVYMAQGGTSLLGSYTTGSYIASVGCEGPNAIKINGTWYVYADFYSQMGLCTSSDGTTWTNRNNEFVFPANGKHGSVFTVSRSVADNLIANASLPTTEIEFDNYATGTNNFMTDANWLGGFVPGNNQIAAIQSGHTVNLTSSPTGTLSGLKVGQTSSGILNISGNAALNVSGDVKIGGLNAVGSFSISGGALNATGSIQVGNGAVHLDGGTISTASVYGSGNTAAFHFNGGTLKATNSTTSFMTGLNTVDVESGGAVIDTNSYNITIPQSLTTASAAGGLTKNGAGILTLSAANTYSGSTTISAGTLKLGTSTVSATHRWSFNGSLADSVGGSSATIVTVSGSTHHVTLSSTQATITGGSSTTSDYISLGTNLLPKTNSPVTIELWATQITVQNWSRIFDLGSSSTENLFMSWTQGTTLASDRVEWKDAATKTSDNTNQPYTLNTEYHIVMELKPLGDSTIVTWYSAASTSADLGSAKGTFTTTNTLALLNDTYDWLGRSEYSADYTANASYNEVRFWDGALSSSILEILHNAGPNADLTSLNLGGSGSLPSTTDVNITASGATLDLNNISQTVGSLSGVAGSSVLLGSGTLTLGGNASTAFSGAISGAGGIIKNGTGTFTLTGVNSFTGAVSFNGGLIKAASLSNLGNGTALNFNGGGLQFDGVYNPSVRTMTFQSGGATLDTQTNNITLANAIGNGGTGGLTKKGSGTLTLNGINTFSGAVNFNGGLINAGSLNKLGTGTALNFNGGGLQFAGVYDPSVRTMTFLSGGATLDTQTNNITLANAIGNGGTGGLTKNGQGLLTLTGNPTYTGETVINAGQLLLNTGTTSLTAISGAGGLIVGDSATSTKLTASSISVGTLTIAANSTVTISAISGGPSSNFDYTVAVPEPGVWLLLLIAAAAVCLKKRR